MAKFTDKNSYTILFAVIMVLVVGSLLAGVAQGLRGTIAKNERFEKQQNILYAMGVNDNDESGSVAFIPTTEVEAAFDEYIKQQLVIQGDQIVEDENAYLIDVSKEEALAKSADYERRLPLFVGEKDGKTVYIIPMRGKGLWDAIWGYVSLDENMVVQGAFFDHAGETPGLGANIKERYFMDDFIGEHILDANGNFAGVAVAKGNNDPRNLRKQDNKVDAISGSTITGDGVSAMIRKYLREYIPHLEKIINESK